ncbi:MAG: hypothetical protein ABI618_15495 [Nitrospirota bacterium]
MDFSDGSPLTTCGDDVGGDAELTGKGCQHRQLVSEIFIPIAVIPDILNRESILSSFQMNPRLLLAGMTTGGNGDLGGAATEPFLILMPDKL